MAKFFIDRPVFAWVLALFIILDFDHPTADLAVPDHCAAVSHHHGNVPGCEREDAGRIRHQHHRAGNERRGWPALYGVGQPGR